MGCHKKCTRLEIHLKDYIFNKPYHSIDDKITQSLSFKVRNEILRVSSDPLWRSFDSVED